MKGSMYVIGDATHEVTKGGASLDWLAQGCAYSQAVHTWTTYLEVEY
jgi:hypothetical protein